MEHTPAYFITHGYCLKQRLPCVCKGRVLPADWELVRVSEPNHGISRKHHSRQSAANQSLKPLMLAITKARCQGGTTTACPPAPCMTVFGCIAPVQRCAVAALHRIFTAVAFGPNGWCCCCTARPPRGPSLGSGWNCYELIHSQTPHTITANPPLLPLLLPPPLLLLLQSQLQPHSPGYWWISPTWA
jgi:hypothetical protein